MSQANVDVLRRFNDAFRLGDWVALAALMDPHVHIRTDPAWPEEHVYGIEAATDWYRGAWESLGHDARVEEIVDLGDRVLARYIWSIHGQQSGVEAAQGFSELATFRAGRVILVEYFFDHNQALEALEIRE